MYFISCWCRLPQSSAQLGAALQNRRRLLAYSQNSPTPISSCFVRRRRAAGPVPRKHQPSCCMRIFFFFCFFFFFFLLATVTFNSKQTMMFGSAQEGAGGQG